MIRKRKTKIPLILFFLFLLPFYTPSGYSSIETILKNPQLSNGLGAILDQQRRNCLHLVELAEVYRQTGSSKQYMETNEKVNFCFSSFVSNWLKNNHRIVFGVVITKAVELDLYMLNALGLACMPDPDELVNGRILGCHNYIDGQYADYTDAFMEMLSLVTLFNTKYLNSLVITKEIEEYWAPCPCPYSRDINNNVCGNRSAFSRAGGASPICYDYQVSSNLQKEALRSTISNLCHIHSRVNRSTEAEKIQKTQYCLNRVYELW